MPTTHKSSSSPRAGGEAIRAWGWPSTTKQSPRRGARRAGRACPQPAHRESAAGGTSPSRRGRALGPRAGGGGAREVRARGARPRRPNKGAFVRRAAGAAAGGFLRPPGLGCAAAGGGLASAPLPLPRSPRERSSRERGAPRPPHSIHGVNRRRRFQHELAVHRGRRRGTHRALLAAPPTAGPECASNATAWGAGRPGGPPSGPSAQSLMALRNEGPHT